MLRQYPNEHGMTHLNFTAPATVFCPLGPNYYRAEVTCEIELGGIIVDFVDLENYFKKELNGKHLTTEALVNEVFTTLARAYGHPKNLTVKVHSDSHFPIDTIKTTKGDKV